MNQFKDGKKHGYWEEISNDGHLNKVNYVDGNPYGLVETFYPNGKLKCKLYAFDGRIDKFCLVYYENGKLWKNWNLKNGKFHGIIKDTLKMDIHELSRSSKIMKLMNFQQSILKMEC